MFQTCLQHFWFQTETNKCENITILYLFQIFLSFSLSGFMKFEYWRLENDHFDRRLPLTFKRKTTTKSKCIYTKTYLRRLIGFNNCFTLFLYLQSLTYATHVLPIALPIVNSWKCSKNLRTTEIFQEIGKLREKAKERVRERGFQKKSWRIFERIKKEMKRREKNEKKKAKWNFVKHKRNKNKMAIMKWNENILKRTQNTRE